MKPALKIWKHRRRKAPSGFTLIELLVVMAIIGVLATAVIVAINPNKRMAQARDAQRKSDISAIANALIGFYTITGNYPTERNCDSSKGSSASFDCNNAVFTPPYNWGQTGNDRIYEGLILKEQFLKKLPIDPINNNNYYYRYEPAQSDSDPSCWPNFPCDYYWIGARLESTDNFAGDWVFRCSDDKSNTNVNTNGLGCKEVQYTSGSFGSSQR